MCVFGFVEVLGFSRFKVLLGLRFLKFFRCLSFWVLEMFGVVGFSGLGF